MEESSPGIRYRDVAAVTSSGLALGVEVERWRGR
jgi:hypothetical protein